MAEWHATARAARRGGAHRSGAALAIGGGLVAFAGGHLGGHLSLVRKIGTAHPDFGSESANGDVRGH